ncbi:hypothetical protein AALP_AA7G275900 [Arabis alpina]|uniref:VQ domain-containing protein n=1 Tax=Arabis alpina TaxID=50452 RepID=A0A087GKZ1_ARAAL|nr:hypothetical protein AALP_AA7G275900 [Arabis alpina]
MESGNSSSMQSSSGGVVGGGGGGEEEYDSRAADQSISALFDHHNHHVSSLHPPQQNHLDLLHFNNNDTLIQPNYFNNNNTFLSVNQQVPDPVTQPDLRTFSSTSSLPPPIGVIKKTKKRSRASRRAPTTVLTTDTSNFRAMVQEFTGIPAPPLFNNNSVVNTTRLNTFLGLSSTSPNNLLLGPFAHKLLPTSQIQQQYQNPNNSFENMNLQALLQAQISSNPRSNDHDQFGLGISGMLQTPSTTPALTTEVANGNITTGENGSYGGSDHNNDV